MTARPKNELLELLRDFLLGVLSRQKRRITWRYNRQLECGPKILPPRIDKFLGAIETAVLVFLAG